MDNPKVASCDKLLKFLEEVKSETYMDYIIQNIKKNGLSSDQYDFFMSVNEDIAKDCTNIWGRRNKYV
jgi:hypothetical protein